MLSFFKMITLTVSNSAHIVEFENTIAGIPSELDIVYQNLQFLEYVIMALLVVLIILSIIIIIMIFNLKRSK